MRRELPRLRPCCSIRGIRDLGPHHERLLLAALAQALFDAGMRRINISLDTLDPERFRQVARRDGLEQTLEGIEAARRAGFNPIKINAVSMRGLTENEVVPLARYARERGLEMRFIEYMPIGAYKWDRQNVYFADEILEQLTREFGPVVPVEDQDPRAPAQEFRYTDGGGRLGIIASVSRPFCMRCNRIRLTADGKRAIASALDEVDVKQLLRTDAARRQLPMPFAATCTTNGKATRSTRRASSPLRTMHAIGGCQLRSRDSSRPSTTSLPARYSIVVATRRSKSSCSATTAVADGLSCPPAPAPGDTKPASYATAIPNATAARAFAAPSPMSNRSFGPSSSDSRQASRRRLTARCASSTARPINRS